MVKACFLTKTRLMGVVAGYILYEDQGRTLAEFYHVEFEEYGIDRFDQLINPTDFQIKQVKLEIFGGLGGPLVEVSEEVFKQFLLVGYHVNTESEDHHMALEKSLWYKDNHTFDAQVFKEAMIKMTEDLRSPYELMHYFVMRYVGQDLIYLRYTTLDLPFLDERYTLLRNHIEKVEDQTYRFSALVLADGHEVIEGSLELNEGIVVDFSIDAHMSVSDLEAALMLKKTEHIYLYDVDTQVVEQMLVMEHKYLATTLYEAGRLYTCYRPTNDHVNRKTFYLYDDVEVYFYFTDSGQLLLAGHDLKAIIKWDDRLLSRFGSDVDKYEELEYEESILYDFVDSGYDEFEAFLEAMSRRG